MLSFSLKLACLTLAATIMLVAPLRAENGKTEYDTKSAVIFAYFAIGNDDNPNASITREQFAAQIDELTSGPYHLRTLPDIIAAFERGADLPDRTVALTFDGADKSVIETAAPLLIEKKIPFTVFIPAEKVEEAKPPYMTWDDLRNLKKSGFVTFGIHPSSYARLHGETEEEIRRQINNSISLIRKALETQPVLFAYPFGEYDSKYKEIIASLGFKAAFGQNSGVAYPGDDFFAFPRFTQTERYADMDRFIMTANALPLPVRDVAPGDTHLSTLTPPIGFTVPDSLSRSIKGMSCFASGDLKPSLEFLNNRVEIRLPAFAEDRPRINCTLPVPGALGDEPRWRWFGMLYTVPSELLESAERNAQEPQEHASDTQTSVNME